MPKVKFVYEKNVFEITEEDTIENALKRYKRILRENDLIFLYKGKIISEKTDILKKLKRNNNIIITVKKIKKEKMKEDIGSITCSECKELAFMNINEENIIKIDNCINKHKNKYTINEFIENEEKKENEIICDICKNKKYIYNNDNFYICTCGKNICQICMINHIKNKDHNLLYYYKRYSHCNKHLIEYVSYCSNCNKNLCEKCEKEHIKHKNKII